MIGASGVGKTAFYLYPNLEYACASGMSFLVTDTKGDVYRSYGSVAKDCYGYSVAVIDLRNPTRSDGNNMLHLVNKYMMLIEYQKLKGQERVSRLVKPVGLMFSEFYFYMTAFIEWQENENPHSDSLYPTIYRVDRIQNCKVSDEHFTVPYKERFQEGEFRKRVQFMFSSAFHKYRTAFPCWNRYALCGKVWSTNTNSFSVNR